MVTCIWRYSFTGWCFWCLIRSFIGHMFCSVIFDGFMPSINLWKMSIFINRLELITLARTKKGWLHGLDFYDLSLNNVFFNASFPVSPSSRFLLLINSQNLMFFEHLSLPDLLGSYLCLTMNRWNPIGYQEHCWHHFYL